MSSVFIRRMIVAGGRELPRRHEFWTRASSHLGQNSVLPPESDPDPSLSQHLHPPPQVLFSPNPFTTSPTITPHTLFSHNHYHIPLPSPPSYPPFLDIPLFAPMPAVTQVEAPTEKVPTFSPQDVTVIYVLGGPGVGKGTQCANLVRDYGFVHLSAGNLLREEQNRDGSEFGELIKTYIREGNIVPMEVTVALIENAMKGAIRTQGKSKFLIDGFPRKLDQAYKFEEEVCPSAFTLFFDTTEDVMLERLMKRGETSGRADDNIESIKKRFRTFKETSYPVVEYFKAQGKVVDVDAAGSPVDVYTHVKEQLKGQLETVEKKGV